MTAERQEQPEQGQQEINVGSNERLGSILGGSLLVLWGLRRRSTFGALMMIAGGAMIRRGVTGHCPISAALGRNTAQAPEPREFFENGIHVVQSARVQKPAEELYRFWRNFENLPQIMQHLESVRVLDEGRSHWVAKGPAGQSVEWDAQVINDEPNRVIAWRSVDGADVHSAGSVRFVPSEDGRATDVHVTVEYLPPAGEVGRWFAKMLGEEPEQQIGEDLQHFKEHMETGAAQAAR